MRLIVCAAMRKGDFIVAGARHFDEIMRAQIKSAGLDTKHWEQGFIDQDGRFWGREEAWRIADAAGQIRRPTGWEDFYHAREAGIGDEGKLFSENLY